MTSDDRTLSPGRGRHYMIDPMQASTGTVDVSSYDPYDAPKRYDYDDYPSDASYSSVYGYHTHRPSNEVHPVSSHRIHNPTTTAKKRTEYTVQPSKRHRSNTASAADLYETPARLAINSSSHPSPSPVIHSGHDRTPHRRLRFDGLKKGNDIDDYEGYSYSSPREQFDRDYPVKPRRRGSRYSLDRPLSITGEEDNLQGLAPKGRPYGPPPISRGLDELSRERPRSSMRSTEDPRDIRKSKDGLHDQALVPMPHDLEDEYLSQHDGRSRRRSRRRGHSDDFDTTDDDLRNYRRELPAIAHRRHSSTDTSKDNWDESHDRSHRHRRQDDSRGYHEDDARPAVAVDPPATPKEPEATPKGILKATREAFPEEPNPVREGVAPPKDAHKQGIPPGARWTKIDRCLVNPEALIAGNEPFEERSNYVIVLRVLMKEEIQAYAVKTQEIRDSRRKEYVRNKRRSRDQIHRHGRGEDPSSDDEDDECDDEPPKQRETPPTPDAQKPLLPERPRASSNSMPEAERPSIEKGAEVNVNDQTGSVRDSHKCSEPFSHGIEAVRCQGDLPSMNVVMDSPVTNSEMDQAELGMEFVHPSSAFHLPRQPSSPHDSGSSCARSMATVITSPDLEDDSIDSGIPGTKNMDHILDSARYFSELDKLELKTAQILGLEDGPHAILACLDDCLDCFINWKDALGYLQSQGFCGSIMSLLVEDQDQNDIAGAFHISLDQIDSFINRFQSFMDPLNEQAIMELAKKWIQQILNVQDGAFADVDLMRSVRILCQILSIGLLSFSGSHVCRFDDNLWGQQIEEVPIGFNGYAFRPRKLACLEDFIGGPAWVLSKASTPAEILEQPRRLDGGYGPSPHDRQALKDTEKVPGSEPPMASKEQQEQSQLGMKVSFTVQDLQELWGPVSLVGGTGDEGPVIRTERGFIVPVPREHQPSLHRIECHWTTEIPDHLTRESPDIPILLRNTSKILIGTTTKSEIGLVVNDKCKSSIPLIQQQIACRLQYPGTCKSRYVSDGFDVQLVGGQYITAGLMKKYKRIPRRTLKAMLIEDCPKLDTRLVPLLNLRVGLEVSICTGNAQRVTLWDALRLSQTGAQSTDNTSCCAHEVGNKECILLCWTRWQSSDEIDSLGGTPGPNNHLSGAEARRVIINSILALEHSGVDSEGNLQVCWPFSHSPVNCPILPSSPREAHHWFPVVKDSRDTSSFAVFSQRCLEFPEQGLVRSCSAPCKEGHFRPLQTILATQILTNTEEGSVSGLLQGAKFVIGEAHLTVTKAVRDQMAIIAAVSVNPLNPLRFRLRQILPDARAFDFKEHIRPDIATDLSLPVFAY